MPEFESHPPGSFCWVEVGTVDVARTRAFYGELFGWSYEDRPAGAFGTYTMCRLEEKDLAGLYQLPPQLVKTGLAPHWMSYVSVPDAEAACTRIREHGGEVQQGPFDVMDAGRMAICKDPTGAVFSVWQARAHGGCGLMGEKGTPCWFELSTRNVERAEAFYRAVFEWGVKAGTDAGFVYREFSAPGLPFPQGGMTELSPEHGDAPPHWMIYFTVEDCDVDVERALRLGGRVVVPPADIPKVGRFAILADPAGARFAVIRLSFDPLQEHEAPQAAAPEPPAPRPAPRKRASGKAGPRKSAPRSPAAPKRTRKKTS